MTKKAAIHHLSELLSPSALELLSASGSAPVELPKTVRRKIRVVETQL